MSWRVNGDFTTMMIGGVSALLLQMLHPSALAGVWDHSDFRRDMSGRLKRTAQFLSGTTFGSKETADHLVARVRGIHDRVHGHLPDGQPYSANDPELLTWIHVAAARSFITSYTRYAGRLSAAEHDRYYREMAVIAEALGAAEVPVTASAVERYLSGMRPALRFDARTASVVQALLNQPSPSIALKPFSALVMEAGIGLLPPWAARMHGLSSRSRWPTDRLAVRAMRQMTNWALVR